MTRALSDRLHELAGNLWWTWQPDVIALFRDLDPALWRATNHNPIAFLAALSPERLEERAEETGLEMRVNFAFRRLAQYLADRGTWGARTCGVLHARPVAYFSAEFALHESLPIYSGGLGALAGDHLKAASDLGVPLVALGIFYAEGYFRQRIDAHGWQEEGYGTSDVQRLPLRPAVAPDGQALVVDVPLGREVVRVGAWRAEVGRAMLVLLDTGVEGNTASQRQLTAQLYGGDLRVRICQELILGVGGMRVLAALGIRPGVLHLNEGHSAFAPLELARQCMEADGVPFARAHAGAAQQTVFTTHTPVEAGHDWFPPDLVREHLGWLAAEARIAPDELLALGRVHPEDTASPFCMTVLALRSARHANAVSALHGRVTRRAWQSLWPGRSETEVPIGHITNGVHLPSWVAPQISTLCDVHLGADWRDRMPEVLRGADRIDQAAFWEAHRALKRVMLAYLARRCAAQSFPCPVNLDADALTVGFARRFAEYKRAGLLFTDLDRLARLVNAPDRPLQIVVAGKAHPRDDAGKALLQRVIGLTRDDRFRGKLAFVEDYDLGVARHLVQGTDLWLNTPRRPLEACGTSGQKVLLNGGLNLSVLDGWWAEAYDGGNGFAIGGGETHADPAVQDARDADALYRALENEVVPLYYDRDQDGVPHRWIACVARSVMNLVPRFNAYRMVRDYVVRCYLPAAGGLSSEMP